MSTGSRRFGTIARATAVAVTALMALAGAAAPPAPSAAPTPAAVRPATPNPLVAEACGLNVTLILDASGSISSAGAVDDVREGARAFLDALADTNSKARVIDFATNARETAPNTLVTSASVAQGGVHGQAIADYYNPKPPFTPGVAGHSFRGGNRNINDPNSYTSGNDTQYTNWDAALDTAADQPTQLVVFMTDGDPNAVVDDHPGDPFYRAGDTSPDVRYNLSGSQAADDLVLDRAVEEANRAKAAGARMLAVGVGDAFKPGNTTSVNNLKAVTNGPASVVVTGGVINSINDVDVALVQNFSQLADALREIVTQLCSPSLTIRKLAQSPGDASYQPAPGWNVTVNPVVTTGSTPPYRWILPTANAPVGPKSVITDANGFAQFQWEPSPPTATTTATVTETNKTDFTPKDWSCAAKNPNGSIVSTSGTLDPVTPTFQVTVGPEQIVTCTVRNDFNYAPDGIVTKVNAPTVVRGDGAGGQVTSHYTATNTGNTPLSPYAGTDTECAPVTLVRVGTDIAGDTNKNGLVDPGETWQLSCTRTIVHGITNQPVNIPNTVTLTGRDPTGTLVSGTATDDVDVLTPDIVIDKTVTPTSGLSPLDVTYTYKVHTNGNAALGSVTIADNTAPCSNGANVTGPTGDTAHAGFLDPGETWTYTCHVTGLTKDVANKVTATGQPVTATDAPIGGTVTDTSTAVVKVLSAAIGLTKTADPTSGLPGTAVTYTYVVSNPASATASLQPPPGKTRDTVLTDDRCTSPIYQSGDTGDDSVLDPGEAWTYTCPETFPDPGSFPNVATVTMAVVGVGTTLSTTADALVTILGPGIALHKSASETLLEDGSPVTYTYEVVNTGETQIQNVALSDAGAGACAPITFVDGDDGNGRLDPGEVWEYTCTRTVSKPVPTGAPTREDNTATVTGDPVLGSQVGATLTATADATIRVVKPAIEVVKSVAPTEVRPGQSVTWTATATNVGDEALYNIVLDDDNCRPMVLQSGDTGDDHIADVGEAWVFTCTGPVPADITNTASVAASSQFGTIVRDSDQATVTVFTPSIDLTKTVDENLVPNGTTVTYTFHVVNTGTDQLHNVVIVDSRCSPLAGPTGDTGSDGLMDPGEAWDFTCSRPITQDTVNVAGVVARDHLNGVVANFGIASVAQFVSGISITKTASPTQLIGPGDVTYTYVVRNTGNVPLSDVKTRVADDTCPDPTYVSGDVDGNDLLTGKDDIFETGPEETWTFTCTTTISQDTTNHVVVTGTPVKPGEVDPVIGPDVTANAEATVEVLDPATINIVKKVSGEGDGTFDFSGDLGSFHITTDGGTGADSFGTLAPGTYHVTEVPPDGWALTAVSCDEEGATRSGETISIPLAEGATVTCTFTNVATAPPNTSVIDSITNLPKAIVKGGAAGLGIAMVISIGLAGGLLVVGSRFRPAKKPRRLPMARRVRR